MAIFGMGLVLASRAFTLFLLMPVGGGDACNDSSWVLGVMMLSLIPLIFFLPGRHAAEEPGVVID